MRFYLSSDCDCEPYEDLKSNSHKLIQKHLREIKEAGFDVTFEKGILWEGYQHIVIHILDKEALAQFKKKFNNIKIVPRQFDDEDFKYPIIWFQDR